jgi:hypothetical protein
MSDRNELRDEARMERTAPRRTPPEYAGPGHVYANPVMCRYCGDVAMERVAVGVWECPECAYEEVGCAVSDQEIDAESTEDKCK